MGPSQIQNPVAIVDANVDLRGPEVRDAATAFIEFLYTPRAQREFAACGFRSPCKEVAAETELPCASKLWTVDSRLGGWYAAQKKFFDDQVSAEPDWLLMSNKKCMLSLRWLAAGM